MRFKPTTTLFCCIVLSALPLLFSNCSSGQILHPQQFDYRTLTNRFYLNHPDDYLPLTIQAGVNKDPKIVLNQYLLYSSDKDGDSNIWLRDLKTTITIPLVRHPSRQSEPAGSADGSFLAFVSEERDLAGDLYLAQIDGGPKKQINTALEGGMPENLWHGATNLSVRIETYFANDSALCSGNASEKSPFFSPDGRHLYYRSDRCNPGRYDLWRVALERGDVSSRPERLTHSGIFFPSINEQGAVCFITSEKGIPILEVFNPQTGEISVIKRFHENELILYPTLSSAGETVYYTRITEDTNQNGRIDPGDRGGIYAARLSDIESEVTLLDAKTEIRDLYYSSFNNGSIIYAANRNGNVNIYLMGRDGLVPKQDSIEQQYRITENYRGSKHEYLSLDVVRSLYSKDALYPLYEGKILLEKLRIAKKRNDPALRHQIERELNDATKRNPYARLQAQIETAPQKKIELLRGFIRSESGDTKEAARRLVAKANEDLAEALIAEGNETEGIARIRLLNQKFRDYPYRERTLLLQGSLELRRTSTIPAIYLILSKKNGSVANKILNDIFHFFRFRLGSDRSMTAIRQEMARNDLSPQHRATLQIAKAVLLYEKNRLSDAEQLLKSNLSHLPLWFGVHITGLQTLALIYEKTDRFPLAFQTKLQYGGAYTPESGADVKVGEYLEIINNSLKQIERYRVTARKIAHLIQTGPSQNNIFDLKTGTVDLGGGNREILAEFCSEHSSSRFIIFRLGQKKYVDQYVNFCETYRGYLEGKKRSPPSIADARIAASLLYLNSYSNANMLNIMFLHIKRVNLFPEFYKKYSTRYHRTKIDIAMELLRLKLMWTEESMESLSVKEITRALGDKKVFDEEILNQLSHGYRLASAEAMEYSDTSLIFGHAYTLIQKSVEQFGFYDRIQKKGTGLSRQTLEEIKHGILSDLKNAESQLRYILFTEPNDMDAYLLLGWMYQFIDEMRSSRTYGEEGFLFSLFNGFQRQNRPLVTDGKFYKDIYLKFFPEQLYETNIELYRQALSSRERIETAHEALLMLNLANNYFKLMNFRNATKFYEKVDQLGKRTGFSFFESHIQKALFHYNYGRSLLYEEKSQEATEQFNRALTLYHDHELSVAANEYTSALAGLSDKSKPTKLVKELKKKYDTARYKVALLSALTGLAESYSNNHTEAIRAFHYADYILYELDTPPAHRIPRAGLMNVLAMEYQNRYEIGKSNTYAKLSEKYAKLAGLKRDDSIYQAHTLIGQILGLFLNYGEDFSVIGDGRNPYGFSPLRNYELSLGIRLENMLLQGDLEEAKELIELRREVFLKKDGDVNLGKIGYITSLNQEGFRAHATGQYGKSSEKFFEAAEKSLKYNFSTSFLLNFQNHLITQFVQIESELLPQKANETAIRRKIDDIQKIKKSYKEALKQEYIENKKIEIPNFKFSKKTDGPRLEELVNGRLSSIRSLEALLHYYLGQNLDIHATGAGAILSSRQEYEKALAIIDTVQTDAIKSKEKIQKIIRIQINRGAILLAATKLYQAREQYRTAYETAFEFNAVREMWESMYGQLICEIEIKKYFPSRTSDTEILTLIRGLARLLDSHPHIRSPLQRRIDAFARIAADQLIETGNPQEALRLLQISRIIQIENELFRYPLHLDRKEARAALLKVREDLFELKKTALLETETRYARKDPNPYVRRYRQTKESYLKEKRALLAADSAFASIVHPETQIRPERPSLQRGQGLIRLFHHENTTGCWFFSANRNRFESTREALTKSSLGGLLSRCIDSGEKPNELFIIPDNATFSYPLEELVHSVAPSIDAISFTSSESDRLTGYITSDKKAERAFAAFNIFNIRQKNVPDILFTEPVDAMNVFRTLPDRGMNAAEWISRPQTSSVAVLKIDSEHVHKTEQVRQLMLTYDILRLRGNGTMIFSDKKFKLEDFFQKTQNKPYSSYGLRIFGANGFDADHLQDWIRHISNEAMSIAQRYETDGDHVEAKQKFDLAASYATLVKRDADLRYRAELHSAKNLSRIDKKLGARKFDEILNAYPEFKLESLLNRLQSLYAEGAVQEANDLREKMAQNFPGESARLQATFDVNEFVSRIKAPSYNLRETDGDLFFKKFSQIKQRIPESIRKEISLELLRHTFYTEALETGDEGTRFLTNLDHYLLGLQNAPPPSPPQLPSEAEPFSFYLQTRPDTGESRFSFVLNGEQAVRKSWELRLQKKFYSIFELEKYIDRNETKTLRLIDRSALFRLLLDALTEDSATDSARILLKFLEEEKTVSGPDRTSLFSLLATEKCIELAQFDCADKFFRIHLQLKTTLVPRDENLNAEAKFGLVLLAAGKLKQWLPEVKWSGFSVNLQDYRLMWEKRLRETNLGDYASFIRSLPEVFTTNEINNFNRQLNLFLLRNDQVVTLAAVAILKERAMELQKWDALLDSAFLENRLIVRNHFREKTAYRPLASRLLKKLPSRQKIVALVDSDRRLFRISLADGKISATEQFFSPDALRSMLRRYLNTLRSSPETPPSPEELSATYRTLLLDGDEREKLYFWMDGIHSLAPIIAERGDRMVQIFAPEPLIANRIHPEQSGFSPYFSVRATPERRINDPQNEEERWLEQLRRMETVSLGRVVTTGRYPLHIYTEQRLVQSRTEHLPWFLANPVYDAVGSASDPETEAIAFLYEATAHATAPGVIRFHQFKNLSHPEFVKTYYARSLTAGISRRFLEASLTLQKEIEHGAEIGTYRLITPAFLRE